MVGVVLEEELLEAPSPTWPLSQHEDLWPQDLTFFPWKQTEDYLFLSEGGKAKPGVSLKYFWLSHPPYDFGEIN